MSSFLDQIPGPVLAVAHSYGGAVITNAATNANNVVGLVYVAAFAPDEGETLGAIASNSRDSVVLPALVELQYPTGEGEETAVEFTIDPEKFHEVFAFDLSEEQSALMAATQRPLWVAVLRAYRSSGVEEAAILGGGRYRRQSGGHRCRPFDGRARRGYDHRGRGLPRDHDLAATGRRGDDPERVGGVPPEVETTRYSVRTAPRCL